MNRPLRKYLFSCVLVTMMTSCYKELLPKEKDHFSNNCNFNSDTYTANLGRTNVFYGIFNPDYSTQPLTFALQDIFHPDGTPAPELQEQVNTWQWKEYYSGAEKSIAEIEAKRIQVKRPVFDIRVNSGDLVLWNTDTTKIKPGIHIFNVLVKNGGGQKLFQKIKLDIRRPKPYDPYEFDDITGLQLDPAKGGIIHPALSGMEDQLNNALNPEDVIVYFRKTDTKNNTLSFKFYDKDSLPIRLSSFNITQWDSLRYRSNTIEQNVFFGFNRRMQQDSTIVTWDITSPFPVLADVGVNERATISFAYDRVSYGMRKQAGLALTFAIFEPGSWEVIIKFRVNPKFAND
ncbi:DUF5007 domain-containing protein [Chitinophaga sp. 30R24]|uniref:DUF5007 domain-containing protein n=1 Tax=Chitinophaga sp. 30R24 TaxID=3248838 RepID=UPI003B91105F